MESEAINKGASESGENERTARESEKDKVERTNGSARRRSLANHQPIAIIVPSFVALSTPNVIGDEFANLKPFSFESKALTSRGRLNSVDFDRFNARKHLLSQLISKQTIPKSLESA